MKRRFIQNRFTLWVGLALWVSACGIFDKKSELQYSRRSPEVQALTNPFLDRQGRIVFPEGRHPGFETVSKLVFVKHCVSCHGKKGGVSVETYSETVKFLKEIQHTVLDKQSMPPKRRNDPLSDEQKRLVRDWLESGAPEKDIIFDPTAATPTPSPTVDPSPTAAPSPVVEPSATPSATPAIDPTATPDSGIQN